MNRYYFMYLEQVNIDDLNKSAQRDELFGIVDEIDGGIIAYAIGVDHARRITEALLQLNP
jgi:hypothetical protein